MATKRIMGAWLLLLPLLTAAAMAEISSETAAALANPLIKTIYVVPSSHWNLGDSSNEHGGTKPYHFVAPPEIVKLDAKAHVDEVLETALKHDDFYWTIEALWMFEAWWDNTPDAKRRDQMIGLVREGRITLSAPTHQYRSAFLGGEEINRVAYDAERWRREYQIPLDTAMMNDVPGWNWSLVQPLKKSGVKYFFAGPNTFIGGELKMAPRSNPFWWQGPDGSRVLTWISLGAYTEGQTRVYINPSTGRFFAGMGWSMPGVSLGMEDAERKKIGKMNDPDLMDYNIGKEMDRLRKGNYPYDAILVMYSHDTLGPNNIVGTMKYIKDWNSRHKVPQIVVSNPQRFFEHLETTYGADAFPVFSGDWAGLWETTGFPNPNIVAQMRYSREHAPLIEKFSSIAQLVRTRPYPWNDMHRINSQILENVDQGGNGVAAPVYTYQSAHALYQATLSLLLQDVATTAPSVVVFNPTSARRTDIVDSAFLKELDEKDNRLVDSATGKQLPWVKSGERRMQFVATDVAPLGYKAFYAIKPESKEDAVDAVTSPNPTTIENEFYRVSVNAKTGDVDSIFDKQAKREIVDQATSYGLNGLCDSPRGMWGDINRIAPRSAVSTATVAGGTARLIVRREGTPFTQTEIALHAGVKRVDLRNVFTIADGAQLADGYYVSFPFAIAKDSVVPRVENANAFLTPGGPGVDPTYLPGAYTGAYVPTRSVEVHEADAYGIVLANLQSSDVQFGSTTSTVFSKIFTPEHGQSSSAVPPARELHFDYAITSYSGAFDPTLVRSFSEGFVVPFWGDWRPACGRPGELFKPVPGPLKEQQLSFLEISAPNVRLSAWKRVERGDENEFLLRFQEVGGLAKTDVSVQSKFALEDARLTDMVENPLEDKAALSTDPLRFPIGANETLSIRAHFVPFEKHAE